MTARIDLRLKWMDNYAPAPHNNVTWLKLQCVFELEVHIVHLEGRNWTARVVGVEQY